ncbi:MAG: hypothetical protein K8F59_02915 [Rhodobacteraceae bacterium]|nr:hypothetical protein [Paracoccaceae bacterium]
MVRDAIVFLRNEDGAVTVDWIVVTGLVIGAALSVINGISGGMEERGTEMFSPVVISTDF